MGPGTIINSAPDRVKYACPSGEGRDEVSGNLKTHSILLYHPARKKFQVTLKNDGGDIATTEEAPEYKQCYVQQCLYQGPARGGTRVKIGKKPGIYVRVLFGFFANFISNRLLRRIYVAPLRAWRPYYAPVLAEIGPHSASQRVVVALETGAR